MLCVSQVCSESQRFEKLMEHFKNEDNNIDFMVGLYFRVLPLSSGVPFKLTTTDVISHHHSLFVTQVACMQFINIVVHSVEDMNFRVHLQYDFTKLALDDYLEV